MCQLSSVRAAIPPSDSIFLYFLDPDNLTLEFSCDMEEFFEMSPRKPRSLEVTPEPFSYWGPTRDPRQGHQGQRGGLGVMCGDISRARAVFRIA